MCGQNIHIGRCANTDLLPIESTDRHALELLHVGRFFANGRTQGLHRTAACPYAQYRARSLDRVELFSVPGYELRKTHALGMLLQAQTNFSTLAICRLPTIQRSPNAKIESLSKNTPAASTSHDCNFPVKNSHLRSSPEAVWPW